MFQLRAYSASILIRLQDSLPIKPSGIFTIVLTFVIFMAMAIFEDGPLFQTVLKESPPVFGRASILQTLLALACATAIVMTLWQRSESAVPFDRFWRFAILGSLILCAGGASIFLVSPSWFYTLGREDYLIEYASAGFAVVGALSLVFALVQRGGDSRATGLWLAFGRLGRGIARHGG